MSCRITKWLVVLAVFTTWPSLASAQNCACEPPAPGFAVSGTRTVWISPELTAAASFRAGLTEINTQMGNYINGVSFDPIQSTAADVIVRVVDNTASGKIETNDNNNGQGVITIPRRFVSNTGLMVHAGIHETLHTIGFVNAVPGQNVPANCTAADTVMFHETTDSGPFPGLTCGDTAAMGKTWRRDESPILMNVYGGSIKLSGPETGVLFDIAARGTKDFVSWPEQPFEIAFLAMDRNGNGAIDDARELFGNHTLLQSGLKALNGYEALKEFDSNADEWVDASDAGYPNLLLWFDLNRNGLSEANELLRLSEVGVTRLSTRYTQTRRTDEHGNMFRFSARVVSALPALANRSWDVYLRVLPSWQ